MINLLHAITSKFFNICIFSFTIFIFFLVTHLELYLLVDFNLIRNLLVYLLATTTSDVDAHRKGKFT